jgi:hypothetical protein
LGGSQFAQFSQASPGKRVFETTSQQKKKKKTWAWWHMPVISATKGSIE